MKSNSCFLAIYLSLALAMAACSPSPSGNTQTPTGDTSIGKTGGGDSSGGNVNREGTKADREVTLLKQNLHQAFRRFFYLAKPQFDTIDSKISVDNLLEKIDSLEVQPVETDCEESGETRDASYDYQGHICLSMPRLRELPAADFTMQLLALGAHEVTHALGGDEVLAQSTQAFILEHPELFGRTFRSVELAAYYYAEKESLVNDVLKALLLKDSRMLCQATTKAGLLEEIGSDYLGRIKLPEDQGPGSEQQADLALRDTNQLCYGQISAQDRKQTMISLIKIFNIYQNRLNQLLDGASEQLLLESARFGDTYWVYLAELTLAERAPKAPIRGQNFLLLNQTACSVIEVSSGQRQPLELRTNQNAGSGVRDYVAQVEIKDVQGNVRQLKVAISTGYWG